MCEDSQGPDRAPQEAAARARAEALKRQKRNARRWKWLKGKWAGLQKKLNKKKPKQRSATELDLLRQFNHLTHLEQMRAHAKRRKDLLDKLRRRRRARYNKLRNMYHRLKSKYHKLPKAKFFMIGKLKVRVNRAYNDFRAAHKARLATMSATRKIKSAAQKYGAKVQKQVDKFLEKQRKLRAAGKGGMVKDDRRDVRRYVRSKIRTARRSIRLAVRAAKKGRKVPDVTSKGRKVMGNKWEKAYSALKKRHDALMFRVRGAQNDALKLKAKLAVAQQVHAKALASARSAHASARKRLLARVRRAHQDFLQRRRLYALKKRVLNKYRGLLGRVRSMISNLKQKQARVSRR